ncbi:hypothetical protein ACFPK5_00800 [Streptomyces beijiangensis]|uniref:hypothetical protein n=1 Tax=Streptomyces beijiangensis TaxID=163361 RepID=UPI0031D03821
MADDLEANLRRTRRLMQLKTTKTFERVNAALDQIRDSGPAQLSRVALRASLLDTSEDSTPAPATALLLPRGVALRFYLLAVFEAQCRLTAPSAWKSSRSLTGERGWSDLIAVDSGYDSATDSYMTRQTKQARTAASSRLRQVQAALRTLEALGKPLGDGEGDQGLVVVPRTPTTGRRQYAAFELMAESGRGSVLTNRRYTVPASGTEAVFTVPSEFFTRGWVQVLTPAETVTWLILQLMSQDYPGKHHESGVYLYANRREGQFNMARDAFEDACRTLNGLGLIRYAEPPPSDEPGAAFWFSALLVAKPRYQAQRYQVVDETLQKDALEQTIKELVIQRRAIVRRSKVRRAKGKSPS